MDRRLENVVASGWHQAAADEHDGGNLIELRELADRVENHRIRIRFGVDRQLGSPNRRQPFLTAQPLGVGEALRMPRRQHQQRAGRTLRDAPALERADHRFLFAAHRAARDEHLS